MPRWGFVIAALVMAYLQYRIWIGPGSIPGNHDLSEQIEQIATENRELSARNASLEREVRLLESDLGAIEYHARMDLGMVKPGESFFLIVHE